MKPQEQYYLDVNNFKIGLVVVFIGVAFYFVNQPGEEVVHYDGRITSCSDYRFFRETGKELTVMLSNGTTKLFKYHKCHVGKSVSIAVQKRVITRQHFLLLNTYNRVAESL